ncbi:MAG: hypothetical protein ACREA0_03040 [bacterium]
MQHHTGWSNTQGSSQTNNVHGTCYTMGTQRASGDWNDDRFHIRIFYAHYTSTSSYSVGDAHWEEWTARLCHAVPENTSAQGSGFDKGKRRLKSAMSIGGHSVTDTWSGNTDTFRQCNGKYAGSNGWTSWAYIG